MSPPPSPEGPGRGGARLAGGGDLVRLIRQPLQRHLMEGGMGPEGGGIAVETPAELDGPSCVDETGDWVVGWFAPRRIKCKKMRIDVSPPRQENTH